MPVGLCVFSSGTQVNCGTSSSAFEFGPRIIATSVAQATVAR
jgi:hypothetical protein